MIEMQTDTAIDEAVETLKFLSDRNRLRILTALTRAETCVCDLIDELNLAQPLVSYHLGKLKKAGLVRSRRDAQWIYYSLDPEAWEKLTSPVVNVFSSTHLPASAANGPSQRCALMPPDPEHGACGDDCNGDCC